MKTPLFSLLASWDPVDDVTKHILLSANDRCPERLKRLRVVLNHVLEQAEPGNQVYYGLCHIAGMHDYKGTLYVFCHALHVRSDHPCWQAIRKAWDEVGDEPPECVEFVDASEATKMATWRGSSALDLLARGF